jgi:hypothetical protein
MKVKDRRVLADYLEFRHLSYAELAAAVRGIAETSGPSKATIGHLVTGTTTGTKREWALAIEQALHAPAGSLFAPGASRVSEHAA